VLTRIGRCGDGTRPGGTANFAAADLDGLVRIVKRKLKKIQYRPHLIDG
jgi:superfamily II DNA/RNA helicase